MLTVLDHFVSRMQQEYQLLIDKLPPAKRILLRRTLRGTPIARLQAELREAMTRPPIDFEVEDVTEQDSWNDLHRLLAPYLLPELSDLPVALDVTRADMEQRDVSELVGSCHEFFKDHSCLYVHVSSPVGIDRKAHLGAVFANQEPNGTRAWCAIISQDDHSSFYFLRWSEVGERIVMLPSHSVGSHGWLLGDRGNLTARCFLLGLSAVHYHLNSPLNVPVFSGGSASSNGRDAAPCAPAAAQRVLGSEISGRFRLIEVSGRAAPSIMPARNFSDRQEGRSLLHKVTVREHGRWQAYGPKWSLRRWITVQSFTKGPTDAPDDTRIKMRRIRTSRQ